MCGSTALAPPVGLSTCTEVLFRRWSLCNRHDIRSLPIVETVHFAAMLSQASAAARFYARKCTLPRIMLPSRGVHASAPCLRGSKNLDWYAAALARREAAEALSASSPERGAVAAILPVEPLHGRKRARAFLELRLAGTPASAPPAARLVLELADDIVPLACTNFLALCARAPGEGGYTGSLVHEVRRGVGLWLGDVMRGDGTGGRSAFSARHFVDENFIGRHAAPGVLSWANGGVHSNSSIFMIGLAPAPHLDGRHVVFGRVLTGLDAAARLAASFSVNLRPATPIVVSACGPLPEAEWPAVDAALAAAAASARIAPAASARTGGATRPAAAAKTA